MFKPEKIYPRDLIAFFVLAACFILIALGINHVVSGITIMIITYYFSKRVYEEKNPNGNLKDKVEKLENKINYNQSIPPSPQNVSTPPTLPDGQLTSGDFKPIPKSITP